MKGFFPPDCKIKADKIVTKTDPDEKLSQSDIDKMIEEYKTNGGVKL